MKTQVWHFQAPWQDQTPNEVGGFLREVGGSSNPLTSYVMGRTSFQDERNDEVFVQAVYKHPWNALLIQPGHLRALANNSGFCYDFNVEPWDPPVDPLKVNPGPNLVPP